MTTFADMVYMLGGVPVGSGLGESALAGGNCLPSLYYDAKKEGDA